MNVMEDRDNNWQKDLQFLLGDTAILEQLAEQKSYIPFSEEFKSNARETWCVILVSES